jgi:putative radical SAM enzyme (TIGR03279 family)
MVKITSVDKNSRADKQGIIAGDVLVSINGNEIVDVLDYRFYLAEREVNIALLRDGEEFEVKIKKGEYDDIGLDFETPLMDKKHSCKNGCIFCFIDQNPEGLRDSIYFKDDDSRLSFIHGNYITLTNMTQKDVDRIVKMRFSPLNISIHTTNPELRVKMMKNKHSGEVLRYLDDFKAAGLNMCGQIVLCRGINDGDELRRSLTDLEKYYPELTSVAVVPAGLTKFRDKLFPLTDFTPEEASDIIDLINGFGEENLKNHGSRIVFAADEFYLKAKRPIPDADYYEDYPQIENGVGLLRSFMDEFGLAFEDISEINSALEARDEVRRVSVATGAASYEMISAMAEKIMQNCPKMEIKVYKIVNNFYGESITVAGLLTGKDIYEQLKSRSLGEELFVPATALRAGDDDFLCGMTRAELAEKLGVKVTPAPQDGYEFLELLSGCRLCL